jgi:hypothetical protein
MRFSILNEKKAAELAFKTVTSSFGGISHARKRIGQSFSPIENGQVAKESDLASCYYSRGTK